MRSNSVSTGNWYVDQLNFYQSANSDKGSVKRNFVIRKDEFELVIADLLNKKEDDPLQHELFLGRRGSGKSTLLRRIQIEIEENQKLSDKYIAINLAEEQAGIYRLFDLWLEVLRELSIKLNLCPDIKDFSSFKDGHEYTRYLYEQVHEILKTKKRKVVLLLDNLDRIVENFDDDGNLLREILLNHNDIQIIGGSTRMDEHFWKYDQPFYEFFRRHRLGSLSSAEIHLLLNYWSELMNLPQLAEFTKANQGKIEVLRILTDGLPRTLQFFIQILLQDSTLYGFDYIKKVMDNVTPLYQERLNNLPAPQRKIVLELAFLWEAASTKQLAERCRMESKLISAQLKQLSNNGVVETITTKKKNHLYRLSERFFNMWLIVTQGNPEQKRKAKWLTIFLETWYDAVQLKKLASQHLEDLQSNALPYDRAFILTKALSQSKYTNTITRDKMLDYTIKFAGPKTRSDLFELPRKYSDIEAEILKAISDNRIKSAHEIVEEIENEDDGVKFRIKGLLYSIEKEFAEAEKYNLLAIKKGDTVSLFNLANDYSEQKKFAEAEKYYLLAIERGHKGALLNLANDYSEQKKFGEAEKYYLLAIAKGNTNALFNLANDYSEQKKIGEAEKYYLLAIEKGHVNALFNLANDYAEQKKFTEAEKYYLLAIEKGHVNALFNLAIAYTEQKKFAEAEKYYLLAIEKGDTDALLNVANNYGKQKKFAEAEKYYLLAIDKGDTDALCNLANDYAEQKKFAEAEKYYLLAIEKGHVDALFNLAIDYEVQKKFDEAEKYYLLAIEKGHVGALVNLANNYAEQKKFAEAEKYYLLAIEKSITDALFNLAFLYYANNQNKYKALELAEHGNLNFSDQNSMELKAIVEIWNGRFQDMDTKINDIIAESKLENLSWFIANLLVQQQTQLVLKLFTESEHSKALQDRYQLFYYAALILNKEDVENLELRIAPEVLPTVLDMVDEIKTARKFYAEPN